MRFLWLGLISLLSLLLLARLASLGVFAWGNSLYPIDCYHLESSMVFYAWRLGQGESLYADFREFPYYGCFFGPIYFWLVNLLAGFLGGDLPAYYDAGRLISTIASLAGPIAFGYWLSKRYDRWSGVLGALAALTPLNMFYYGHMVRPDLLADTIGVMAFLLATQGNKRLALFSCVLFTLAFYTKQTSLIYFVAASLALLFSRRPSRWIVLLLTPALLSAFGAWLTFGYSPLALDSLLGERNLPWSYKHWISYLNISSDSCRDIIWASGAFLLLSCFKRFRLIDESCLVFSLTIFALVTLAKVGSDINYLLPNRYVLGLVVAKLANSRITKSNDGRHWLITTILPFVLLIIVSASLWLVFMVESRAGAQCLYHSWHEQKRKLVDVANSWQQKLSSNNTSFFADDPHLSMLMNDKNRYADPWLFRQLVDAKVIKPIELSRRFDTADYELVILNKSINAKESREDQFAMPVLLGQVIDRRYRFLAKVLYEVYERRRNLRMDQQVPKGNPPREN